MLRLTGHPASLVLQSLDYFIPRIKYDSFLHLGNTSGFGNDESTPLSTRYIVKSSRATMQLLLSNQYSLNPLPSRNPEQCQQPSLSKISKSPLQV
jgi:hypothetical protein